MSRNPAASEKAPVTCLGHVFADDDARREFFRAELRAKLPALRGLPGFPVGTDDDIVALSDPPYYTACPNPWLDTFIREWDADNARLEAEGLRRRGFNVAEPFALPVKEQKNSAVYNAHSYHTKVPPEVVMNYYLHYTQPGDVVLDGFAGTGMAGIAANFCAHPTAEQRVAFGHKWQQEFSRQPQWGVRRCILGDLAPITSFIAYNYSNAVSRDAFVEAANEIFDRLSAELSHLYLFEPECGAPGTTNYVVWSEIQVCPHCRREFVYWDVAVDMAADRQLDEYLCPCCGAVIKKSKSQKAMTTVYDAVLDRPVEVCGFTPVFINYTVGGRRIERNLTEKERQAIIAMQPQGVLPWMPVAMLRAGDKTSDPFRLGIHYLHQFYSKRNFYILARFRQLIEEYRCDERLKKYLMIWFSSCQSRLHLMNRYAPRHHRHVGPLANTFYVSATPTEISPFYFIKSKIKDNALLIESDHNIVNQVVSATCSGLPDNSVDYIFTDPPFGSNIMYSELNFIWEAWLGVATDNSEEAVANKTQRKSIADYQTIMTRCFKEYIRVLKPGRWMTVEFSNTSAAVWNTIQHSLREAGFVISLVTDLNKGRGGLHGIVGVTAVNQDLAITCYKPTDELAAKLRVPDGDDSQNVWDFVGELLRHLPVHLKKANSTAAIGERSAKILFDRVVAYFVQHGYAVPVDARAFRHGLEKRFAERDGMFFTAAQAVEYDSRRSATDSFEDVALFVGSESEGIEWLKKRLDTPATYQDLQPEWMQALVDTRRGDTMPELKTILEENFLQDDDGRWFRPDPEKESDLEKMRNRRLAHEFRGYVETASKPRGRIRESRLEALRFGFRECYRSRDFKTIVAVASRLPESLLMEDEQLLQYYDIAINRI